MATKTITVEAYSCLWLESKRNTVSPNVMSRYKHYVENYINVLLGKYPIEKLEPQLLKLFFETINKIKDVDCTIDFEIYKVISTILRSAFIEGLIKQNPLAYVEIEKQAPRDITIWELDDSSRYFQAALKEGLLFSNLILAEGFTVAEVLGLQWTDVNFNNETITINRSISHSGMEFIKAVNKNVDSNKQGVTKRTINISTSTIALLRKHRKEQKVNLNTNPYNLIITSNVGTPLQRKRMREKHNRLCEQLDIPRATFQDMRHMYIIREIMKGTNYKDIAQKTGNQDLRFLNRYIGFIGFPVKKTYYR